MPQQHSFSLEQFFDPFPPKAAQLIVTIYGDIVEPRGGDLWMGDLISLCSLFDVNESLVRTAVSRLVARKQLIGERAGRRSFYGLTPEARAEFHSAAEVFFAPPDSQRTLVLVHQDSAEGQKELLAHGYSSVGGSLYLGASPARNRPPGLVFELSQNQVFGDDHRAYVEHAFRLGELAEDYRGFLRRFERLEDLNIDGFSGLEALGLRLALVHNYRSVRYSDPRLPVSILPENWPGVVARNLFASLYCKLSERADFYIEEHLSRRDGMLIARSERVLQRLESIQKS